MKKKLNIIFFILFSLIQSSVLPQSISPWLYKGYKELYNREPTAWEKNYELYNGGIWSAYSEIKGYIQQYQESMKNSGLSLTIINLNNGKSAVLFYQNGKPIAVDLIANDAGTLIASGAANLVAAGVTNIVSSNNANLPGITIGSKNFLPSVALKTIPTAGKGILILH